MENHGHADRNVTIDGLPAVVRIFQGGRQPSYRGISDRSRKGRKRYIYIYVYIYRKERDNAHLFQINLFIYGITHTNKAFTYILNIIHFSCMPIFLNKKQTLFHVVYLCSGPHVCWCCSLGVYHIWSEDLSYVQRGFCNQTNTSPIFL